VSETTCKTREAAIRGRRKKPHYYLKRGWNYFMVAGEGLAAPNHDDAAEQAMKAFEARIDWSTWGNHLTTERKLEG
jgi:hypothetical protein